MKRQSTNIQGRLIRQHPLQLSRPVRIPLDLAEQTRFPGDRSSTQLLVLTHR